MVEMSQPYLLIWSSTFKSYLKKFIVLQNKALKIIGGVDWNERASPYYLKFKILKLPDMFKFESAVFTFKFDKHAHGVGRVVGALGSEAGFAGSMLN